MQNFDSVATQPSLRMTLGGRLFARARAAFSTRQTQKPPRQAARRWITVMLFVFENIMTMNNQ
jgi:hypothetical protein